MILLQSIDAEFFDPKGPPPIAKAVKGMKGNTGAEGPDGPQGERVSSLDHIIVIDHVILDDVIGSTWSCW